MLKLQQRQPHGMALLTLGATVHRLDPGTIPFSRATNADIRISGGEYNCSVNLATTFDVPTGVATATVMNNPIGQLVVNSMPRSVRLFAKDFKHDGVRGPNIATVYSDRGFGVRGPTVFYNRANEAGAMLKPGDFNWDQILDGSPPQIVHSGGIFAALGDGTAELIIELFKAARKRKIVTSFDLNFRRKLWDAHPTGASGPKTLRRIAEHTDLIFGNEEDVQLGLGIKGPKIKKKASPAASFKRMIAKLQAEFPKVKAVSTTLRHVHSANRHQWSSILWLDGKFYQAPNAEIDVMDRIGGGDGAASGLMYCLAEGKLPKWAKDLKWSFGTYCVRMSWALGALLTTTPGDTSMVKLADVIGVATEQGARVAR